MLNLNMQLFYKIVFHWYLKNYILLFYNLSGNFFSQFFFWLRWTFRYFDISELATAWYKQSSYILISNMYQSSTNFEVYLIKMLRNLKKKGKILKEMKICKPAVTRMGRRKRRWVNSSSSDLSDSGTWPSPVLKEYDSREAGGKSRERQKPHKVQPGTK